MIAIKWTQVNSAETRSLGEIGVGVEVVEVIAIGAAADGDGDNDGGGGRALDFVDGAGGCDDRYGG